MNQSDPSIRNVADGAVLGDPMLAARLKQRMSLPMIAGPMFLVSGPELIIATCSSGVIGAIPALNARTSEIFDSWLCQIDRQLGQNPDSAPYCVNLIVHKSNPRLEADLDLCARHKVPMILAAVGSPAGIIEKTKAYGGLVFSDAATVRHARRAAEAGVDGLVLLCAGAGGNTGWLNPFAFVAEVRRFFAGPIALAGSIANGRALRAAEILGADMAVIGTSFIAARESLAVDDYREMLIASGADDIVLTSEITGIPANMLRLSIDRSGFRPTKDHKGFDLAGELESLRAWRDVWAAGHGVGDVRSVEPAAAIVDRLRREYSAAQSL